MANASLTVPTNCRPSQAATYVQSVMQTMAKTAGNDIKNPASIFNGVLARLNMPEATKLREIIRTQEGLTSLVLAVQKAYSLRLSLALDLWHLVPYGNKVTFQLGKEAYRKFAYDSKWVKSIIEKAVYEHDEFEWDYAENRVLVHQPTKESENEFGDPNHWRGSYCVIALKTGGYIGIYMTKSQIEKHRDKYSQMAARNFDKSQWNRNPIQMGNKTVLIAACKMVPRGDSFEFDNAVAAAEYEEAGVTVVDAEDVEYTTDAEEAAPVKSGADKARERLLAAQKTLEPTTEVADGSLL